MSGILENWAVVLGGGDGSRLRALTTTSSGVNIPKQYCSLEGTSCLMQDAITRAQGVALPTHVAAVVADEHRGWWSTALRGVNEPNVFVQPLNRGTAHGILYALLKLERLNPNGIVTLLPADHYFRDPSLLTRTLRAAVNLARKTPDQSYLLGAHPEGPDPEMGYILPAERRRGVPSGIAGFKEKPGVEYAQELLSAGALWNLFILVGSVGGILALFDREHASSIKRMREALDREAGGDRTALGHHYQSLESLDFSRDILELQSPRLRVICVPKCGWTALGTPKRVEAVVRKLMAAVAASNPARGESSPFLDLSTRFQAIKPKPDKTGPAVAALA